MEDLEARKDRINESIRLVGSRNDRKITEIFRKV
jgi:hypothetical protein